MFYLPIIAFILILPILVNQQVSVQLRLLVFGGVFIMTLIMGAISYLSLEATNF